LGVPVLTLGVWTDQTTNSKFLADVWKAGVRMRKGEDGNVGREEIERCMRMAVDKKSKAGEEMRRTKQNGRTLSSLMNNDKNKSLEIFYHLSESKL